MWKKKSIRSQTLMLGAIGFYLVCAGILRLSASAWALQGLTEKHVGHPRHTKSSAPHRSLASLGLPLDLLSPQSFSHSIAPTGLAPGAEQTGNRGMQEVHYPLAAIDAPKVLSSPSQSLALGNPSLTYKNSPYFSEAQGELFRFPTPFGK